MSRWRHRPVLGPWLDHECPIWRCQSGIEATLEGTSRLQGHSQHPQRRALHRHTQSRPEDGGIVGGIPGCRPGRLLRLFSAARVFSSWWRLHREMLRAHDSISVILILQGTKVYFVAFDREFATRGSQLCSEFLVSRNSMLCMIWGAVSPENVRRPHLGRHATEFRPSAPRSCD